MKKIEMDVKLNINNQKEVYIIQLYKELSDRIKDLQYHVERYGYSINRIRTEVEEIEGTIAFYSRYELLSDDETERLRSFLIALVSTCARTCRT